MGASPAVQLDLIHVDSLWGRGLWGLGRGLGEMFTSSEPDEPEPALCSLLF